jgi:hypothetical protein
MANTRFAFLSDGVLSPARSYDRPNSNSARMEETLRQADRFLSDTLGYSEIHPVRLSFAKRFAEAEELASE